MAIIVQGLNQSFGTRSALFRVRLKAPLLLLLGFDRVRIRAASVSVKLMLNLWPGPIFVEVKMISWIYCQHVLGLRKCVRFSWALPSAGRSARKKDIVN